MANPVEAVLTWPPLVRACAGTTGGDVNGPQHILAIDASPALLDLFRDLLEGEGYRVSTQPALEPDLSAITRLAPDLIILDDLCRPEERGWPLLQRLRTDPGTQDIPVILCTGVLDEGASLEDHLTAFGVRVVRKPFDLNHLLALIRQTLPQSVG